MNSKLNKLFEQTRGFYPFFKKCPPKYWEYYLKKRAFNTLGYDYNWRTPKTLNEKIRWLIYNEKPELKTKLTDKILVKQYIASVLGKNHSAQLYGIYNDIKEIDISVLPKAFVLKANHGWRMNVFVKNKEIFIKEFNQLQKITRFWLKTNYEYFSLEPQYRNIERKLFLEYFRSENSVNNLRNDIQVWCFNSIPLLIELNYIFYNTNWKRLKYRYKTIPKQEEEKAPDNLDEILEMAQKLSAGFDFVRVDFAVDGNDIHILEMTFTPGSALIPFADIDYDKELGEILKLSNSEVCYV